MSIEKNGVMNTLWLACSITAGHTLSVRRRSHEHTKLMPTRLSVKQVIAKARGVSSP